MRRSKVADGLFSTTPQVALSADALFHVRLDVSEPLTGPSDFSVPLFAMEMTADLTPSPEPGALALVGIGLLDVARKVRRRPSMKTRNEGEKA